MSDNHNSDIVNLEDSKTNSIKECLEQYVGKPVFIMCARHTYRGIVKIVNEKSFVLSKARAVAINSDASLNEEEELTSPAVIMFDFIEMVCQPEWCLNLLD